VSVRSNTVSSPVRGSFAQYLKENRAVELRAAGLPDPASKTVAAGMLTDSQIDAASSRGQGSLGARCTVEAFGVADAADGTIRGIFPCAACLPPIIG
jgi:hypothetical protein